MNKNNLIGYLGRKVPYKLFYGFDLICIPVDGVDRDILKFSKEKNLCSIIDSTLTYANTGKCPYIFSSKLIVIDNSCPLLLEKSKNSLKEKIYCYENEKQLIDKISSTYSLKFNETLYENSIKKLEIINNYLDILKSSNMPSKFLYETSFYINFIFNLDDRINLLEKLIKIYPKGTNIRKKIYVPRAIQIIDEIDSRYTNYEIIEGGKCLGEKYIPNKKMDIDFKYCIK